MSSSDRLRIVFHGAVVVLVGLFCGFGAVNDGDVERLWHTAHEGLIMIGVLMIAISSAMPVLTLPKREAIALVWALLAMGYGLMTGLVLQGFLGQHAFSPTTSPLLMIAFIGNAFGMGGSVISVALTIMGANSAYRIARDRAP